MSEFEMSGEAAAGGAEGKRHRAAQPVARTREQRQALSRSLAIHQHSKATQACQASLVAST